MALETKAKDQKWLTVFGKMCSDKKLYDNIIFRNAFRALYKCIEYEEINIMAKIKECYNKNIGTVGEKMTNDKIKSIFGICEDGQDVSSTIHLKIGTVKGGYAFTHPEGRLRWRINVKSDINKEKTDIYEKFTGVYEQRNEQTYQHLDYRKITMTISDSNIILMNSEKVISLVYFFNDDKEAMPNPFDDYVDWAVPNSADAVRKVKMGLSNDTYEMIIDKQVIKLIENTNNNNEDNAALTFFILACLLHELFGHFILRFFGKRTTVKYLVRPFGETGFNLEALLFNVIFAVNKKVPIYGICIIDNNDNKEEEEGEEEEEKKEKGKKKKEKKRWKKRKR